jgi:2-C-methyl-D-erythritol 4-phosphate cytidylyltransferase
MSPTPSKGGGQPGGVAVAIPAAGMGTRMGGRKKAFIPLAGVPLLLRALKPFLEHPEVEAVVVALPPEELETFPKILHLSDPRVSFVAGGETRLDSVFRALEALPLSAEVLLVHDAARPLVSREVIDRCIALARTGVGAVAGWPAVDTLQETDAEGRIVSTPDRSRLWQAQTPQAFPAGALRQAYQEAVRSGTPATDDATLFLRAGGEVRMVAGSPWNLKITHPDDLRVAEALLLTPSSKETA